MAIRTNVMTDRSLSCRTLAMVASALSRVFGVEVTTTGVDAYTAPPQPGRDKYVINIPAIDVDDARYLTLVRGYIDHEVGHIRFTDSALVMKEIHKDFAMALWNILEDPYVEYKMGLCYMGCERNLRDLGREVFTLEKLNEIYVMNCSIQDMAGMFHSYLLMYVRNMVDAEHFQPLLDYMTDICTQFGSAHILQGIQDIIKRHGYHPSTTNTANNVKIAREIAALLKSSATSQSMCDSEAPDTSQLSKDTQQHLRSGTIREMVQQQFRDDCNASSAKSTGNTSTKFDTSSQAADAIKDAARDAVMNSNMPLPDSDFSSADNSRTAGRLVGAISDYDKKKAYDIMAVLDLRLRSLLQSYIMARGGTAAAGKLDTRKLHRLAVNNPRVFQHRVEKKGVDTEVIVLVDVSGSMSGQKAEMTTQAMYALMTSLSRIKGVRAGAFGFNSDSFPCYVPMGGAVTNQMKICPSGGTLLGEAVNRCLSYFNYDEGSRQVLIILSDGDSQNVNYVEYILKKAQNIGIEIAAVGILDSYIKRYEDIADCRVISDLKELPSTLFNILQDKLIAGGLR